MCRCDPVGDWVGAVGQGAGVQPPADEVSDADSARPTTHSTRRQLASHNTPTDKRCCQKIPSPVAAGVDCAVELQKPRTDRIFERILACSFLFGLCLSVSLSLSLSLALGRLLAALFKRPQTPVELSEQLSKMFQRCAAAFARGGRRLASRTREFSTRGSQLGSQQAVTSGIVAGALVAAGAGIAFAPRETDGSSSLNLLSAVVANAHGEDKKRWPNTTVLDSPAITLLFTSIRNVNTKVDTYINDADRLMRILAEEGLARVKGVKKVTIQTPCGSFDGLEPVPESRMCAVSIVRSGDILLEAVRSCAPKIKVGKILCQRDEEHPEKIAKLYYSKFPRDIASLEMVILVDPMLATGGSASLAIDTLLEAGVKEENIMFLNVVSCPEGLDHLSKNYPKIQIVTAAVDSHLNDDKYIVPGLGDFGDRYYST